MQYSDVNASITVVLLKSGFNSYFCMWMGFWTVTLHKYQIEEEEADS